MKSGLRGLGLLLMLIAQPAFAAGETLVNGNFATGDLTGWTSGGIKGGFVLLVQNGQAFPGNSAADPISFPDGEKSWAADVRSNFEGTLDSVGILVSDLFIPNSPTLKFQTHSQHANVEAQILLLKATADPIYPKPEDLLMQVAVVNTTPGEGSLYSFEEQTVDLSSFYNASNPLRGTPMRLEIRQRTTQARKGWYTLFTNFDAGPSLPMPELPGDLNGDQRRDTLDAVLALQIIAGVRSVPNPIWLKIGDISPKHPDGSYGDGSINIGDVIHLLRRAIGLEPDPWP